MVDASSADEYDPVTNVNLAVTVTDDDTAGVTVSVTQLTVTEAAGASRTATYTVKLNTQPTGDVTITPSSSQESAATVSGALTFTTANWSTEQTVTVTGVDDTVDQGDTDRTATVSHTVSGGDYGDVSAGSVSVSVTDDDTAGITVTAADPFTVAEGSSATYTVKLNTEPSSDVVISLTVSGSRGDHSRHRRGDGRSAEHPDLHRHRLEHSPDRDGQRRPGRRRGERRRDHRPRRGGRIQRRTSTTPWRTSTLPSR